MELNLITARNDLLQTVSDEGGQKVYHIYRQDGQNVVVIFRNGKWSSIKDMPRGKAPVPQNDLLELEREKLRKESSGAETEPKPAAVSHKNLQGMKGPSSRGRPGKGDAYTPPRGAPVR